MRYVYRKLQGKGFESISNFSHKLQGSTSTLLVDQLTLLLENINVDFLIAQTNKSGDK